jgi:4-hydroxy-3-methylbut-2-enyl diphosphate reductase
VDWAWFEGVSVVGVTAGASAPENLVEDLVAAIAARFDARVEEVRVTDEDVVFKLPRVLAE